jgi:hypothetical protein
MANCAVCHGTPPSQLNILNGANSPSTITGAINNVGQMRSLSITAADANNLAAYLATPGI